MPVVEMRAKRNYGENLLPLIVGITMFEWIGTNLFSRKTLIPIHSGI